MPYNKNTGLPFWRQNSFQEYMSFFLPFLILSIIVFNLSDGDDLTDATWLHQKIKDSVVYSVI